MGFSGGISKQTRPGSPARAVGELLALVLGAILVSSAVAKAGACCGFTHCLTGQTTNLVCCNSLQRYCKLNQSATPPTAYCSIWPPDPTGSTGSWSNGNDYPTDE